MGEPGVITYYINSGYIGMIKNRRDAESAEKKRRREKLNNADINGKDITY